MSKIQSSAEHLTLNADGNSKDIKFQANGVEKASISSAGAFTSTTIDATKLTGNLPAISGAALTGVGVAGITSSADATAMTITSDEKVLVNETVSGHADAGTTVITNKALGKAALTLKSLQSHAAGVGTEIVALNFASHNYYSASNPGIYGQISCENGNGSYSDRGQLVFSTGYGGNQITERLVLRSDGKVNIGGTDIVAHLNVERKDAGAVLGVWNSHSDGVLMQVFAPSGANRGGISLSGSTTTYATSSDYRLKENVDYTWDATTRLKQLKPARFNFIEDDTNTLVDGFIAHEVSSVVPEAIVGTKDAMEAEVFYVEGDELPEGKSVGDVKTYSTTKIKPQGIDQSKLVPLLVKTIQELEARITALEA